MLRTELPGRVLRLVAPLHDVLVAGLSVPLAVGLQSGLDGLPEHTLPDRWGAVIFLVLAAPIFHWFRLYGGVWRYFAFDDFMSICKGAAASVLIFTFIVLTYSRFDGVPQSLPAVQFLCLLGLLAGPRVARRVWEEKYGSSRQPDKGHDVPPPVPLLLVGCGEAATLLIRALRGKIAGASYRAVGIVDLSNDKTGRRVLDVPVVGSVEQLSEVLSDLSRQGERPHRLVLTTRLDGEHLSSLQKEADKAKIPVSRMPSLMEFRAAAPSGRLDLRQINVEDLLRRPQVSIDEGAIGRLVRGCRILITGAGGSIGSELCRQVASRQPAELLLLDNSEYNLYRIECELSVSFPSLKCRPLLRDVRDTRAVRRVFFEQRPHYVFHAAALKHVPLMEVSAVEAVYTNLFGTRNVAEAAGEFATLGFVQISTDKAVMPSSIMGATKRLAECLCQNLDSRHAGDLGKEGGGVSRRDTRYMTVRFGNVLGSSGSVVPLFQEQLRQGRALTVTHPEMTRFFMTISEAASLVLQASAFGAARTQDRGLIYVLDMGKPVRILDIAEQVIRLSGLAPYEDVPIEIIGCRPGEKLSEELFEPGERCVASGIPGVIAARSKRLDLEYLDSVLTRLRQLCRGGDDRAVEEALSEYFPGCRVDMESAA